MTTHNNNIDNQSVFFTICSKNFLAHSKVLFNSIKEQYPNAKLYLGLCDKIDNSIDQSSEMFEFILLEQLDIPNLDEMSRTYNITEFNTAIKPFVFLYLFEKLGHKNVVYLDPDILVVDKLEEVDNLLACGSEAILTPHILSPAESNQLDDQKFLLFGVYNLGFLALSNTSNVINYLHWWSRRLQKQCIIKIEAGIFVDQKWCDLLPAFVEKTNILRHPGYNVAYWNLPQRTITQTGNTWFSNNQPLRFVHFSGNKIDDGNTFSRHSSEVTVDNIGDLKLLLDYYREQVYKNGHEFYRKLPYAYSWNGSAGVNLHTPDNLDMANTSETISSSNRSVKSAKKYNLKAKVVTTLNALPVAKQLSGGYIPLLKKVWRSYKLNGINHVKSKVVDLSSYKQNPGTVVSEASSNHHLKKILLLDWAIPKPDQDAASIYTFLLLKIFKSQGYSVSLLPCNLKYEETYSKQLASEGIDVFYYPQVTSIAQWLEDNAANFDICVLSRGPVVWPYLKTIKKAAPNLKLIFNSIDLHHLRELRQAALSNDEALKTSAEKTRDQEYELIRTCDLTFLISTDEAYIVRENLPEAPITVLPLVYDSIPGANKAIAFQDRSDILFIGSFPHLPNIDAIEYFVEQVLPHLVKLNPLIKLKIAGANPPPSISKYADNPNIEILGFVTDLKPLYDSIKLSIAPLRFGAGIKGKIAGSMCYGVPSIATSLAAEGMGLTDNHNILIADSPIEFAQKINNAYSDEALWKRISQNSHEYALNNYSYQVIQKRVANLLWTLNEGWSPLQSSYEIDSWDSYQTHHKKQIKTYIHRQKVEQDFLPEDHESAFNTFGKCAVCNQQTEYLTSFMYSTCNAPNGKPMPNWREHMQCKHCKLVNRVRASMHALHTLCPPKRDSKIYITEQVTSTYSWLKHRYAYLQGSEYLGEGILPGSIVNQIRHENIMELSFDDNSFDYFLSFDVLEHVPDPIAGFKEAYRVLNEGGVMLFTVPFAYDSKNDIIRASMTESGELIHHLPPEYHGNPVDPEGGALCFRYFGWAMLDELRNVGFKQAKAIAYWSAEQGYLGKEQYLFVATK
jgi:glycosyltransferase involved in cell wall biosynthesis